MPFLTRRLARMLGLLIAPLKGFFSFKTETVMPVYDPEHMSFWTYVKEVARQDSILYFEPFTFAVREFKQKRAKPF
jgi:hypothetical protein